MYHKIREAQQGNREEGFTLIELLVVVIIIGILAAIAIPVFLNQRTKARNAAANSDLRNLITSQEAYYTDFDSYDAATDAAPSKMPENGMNTSADVLWCTDKHASRADQFIAKAVHKNGTVQYEWNTTTEGEITKNQVGKPSTSAGHSRPTCA